MELKTFRRGVHPHDGKELSNKAAIKTLNPEPGELVTIPMSQHIGAPCEPIVKPGERVLVGQKIGEAKAFVSSPVHASVSGTVKFVKPVLTPGGAMVNSVIIENDGEFEEAPEQIDAEKAIDKIKAAGIVGMGGAGFPTHVKLSPGPDSKITDIIVNAAECEPYLTCDHRLMLEKTDEIVRGARYLAAALGVKEIIIGIEANKPDAIEKFEPYEDIKVVILKKQYPMGGEKQLTYVTTGRRIGLPPALPADVGVVVQNVATAYAVCEAVELGKPLYERVVTVSGKAVKEPKNVWVKLGTQIKDVIEYCGGELSAPKKVVQGGPMTGVALANYDVYTHKTTSGILLMTADEAAAEEPTPCLNCGKCADVCPMHLMPMNTAFYSAAGDFEAAEKYGNTLACIECGACEYICPAKRPLIQAIRKTKAEIRKLRQGGQKK